MEQSRCLVCCHKIELTVPTSISADFPNSQSLLESELTATFLLSELVELPRVTLCKLFQHYDGSNPSSWVNFCKNCEESVNVAKILFQEIKAAQRKLKVCQQHILEKIKDSECKLKFGGEESHEDSEVLKVVHDHVKKKKYSCFDLETDPSSGDQHAQDLLAINLQTASSHLDMSPPPVFPEVFVKFETVDSPISDEVDEPCELPDLDLQNTPKTEPMEDEFETVEQLPIQKEPERPRPKNKSSIEIITPFPCPQCHKLFPTKKQMSDHKYETHVGRKSKNCPHCDYVTNRVEILRKHIIAKHERPCEFKCDLCDKKLSFADQLRYHQVTQHNKCSVPNCKNVFWESQRQLWEHQQKAHGNEVDLFKCSDCDKLCAQKPNLRSHLKWAHGKVVKVEKPRNRNSKSILGI